jgi:predicted TIM-barrel fold metal-dependent hydrolase
MRSFAMEATEQAVATGLDGVWGRVVDLDSHLIVPLRQLGTVLGPTGRRLGRIASRRVRFDAEAAQPANPGEEAPVGPSTVWTVKGAAAPGATHAESRVRALDLMGIAHQLVFADVLAAMIGWGRRRGALAAMRSYNDYALDWASDGAGRLHPVAVLNTRQLGPALVEARRLAGKSARAVMIADGVLPGGLSPADPRVDRLWATLAEAGIAVLLHIGGQAGFASIKWQQTDLLRTRVENLGLDGDPIGPHVLATMHLSPVNFLSALIFGGVFERHPTLKVGVMELGAMWIGPMAELLDDRATVSTRVRTTLSMRPSDYIRRGVRVTAFWQEPVGQIIDRYGLADVVCFASDFPHREGGTDPLGATSSSLAVNDRATVERFFVTNASLIIPA